MSTPSDSDLAEALETATPVRFCALCLLSRHEEPATERVEIRPGEYQSGANDREAWLCSVCAAEHREARLS